MRFSPRKNEDSAPSGQKALNNLQGANEDQSVGIRILSRGSTPRANGRGWLSSAMPMEDVFDVKTCRRFHPSFAHVNG